MAGNGNGRERVLVVLSMSGGNDGLNTLVPYTNSNYYDYRRTLGVQEDQVLKINDEVGFHPSMTELKDMYDEGNVAVIQGVGYPHPSRSHFRSMDIWHTCEPDIIGQEGWLGRSIRDIDPNGENVLTGVNFGRGLPRALMAPGVPVASVSNIETYGVLTGIDGQDQRSQALETFSRMYSPAIGSGPVMDYIWETGRSALKGADILKIAPERYESTVEYGHFPIAQECAASRRSTSPSLGPGCSTPRPHTTPLTPTLARPATRPACGARSPGPSQTSTTTFESTTRVKKSSCSCSASSDAGPRTTEAGPTTAQAACASSSATT